MVKNRIKELRQREGLSLEELAERVGLSTSYVQRLENEDRNLGVKHFDKFAKALKASRRELIVEDGSPASEPIPVRVVGRIGAGAEIFPEVEQLPPEGLFEITVPFPVPDGAVAFEVDGNSMWPRYDPGDVILCWREGTNATEIIGWEAAVLTGEQKRYLKRIVQGTRKKHYDLESFNAPPIRNVKLEWVSKVQMVVRAGEWQRMGRALERRISKRLVSGRQAARGR